MALFWSTRQSGTKGPSGFLLCRRPTTAEELPTLHGGLRKLSRKRGFQGNPATGTGNMARKSRSVSHRRSSRNLSRSRSALLRPPDRTLAQQARDFIWDRNKKTCLTRSPVNWCAVALYYSIFLGIVILIFAISMKISEVAIDQESGPQYILGDSPIGPSPNLNFFPLNGSQNLIWLSPSRSYNDYVSIIDREFSKYKRANKSFDTSRFSECGTSPYGYDKQTPCFYLRLNRLIMWEPIPYHKGAKLPKNMPAEVRDLIKSSDIPRVWVTCQGTTAKDRDHLPSDMFEYQGEKGFDILGYPFERQDDYVDPIVAIRLKQPDLKILLSVTCYPWSSRMDSEKTNVDVTFYFE